MSDAKRLKKEIVTIGKLLYERGLVSGMAGNISARVNDEYMLITPSGRCKGFLIESDIMTVSIKSGKIEDKGTPSIETPLHAAIYKKREDVFAIIHTHPVHCTVLAVAGKKLNSSLIPEGVLVLGDVPLVPYRTPGSAELARLLGDNITNRNALLLEKHGAVTVGSNLLEAFLRLETLEFIANLQVHLGSEMENLGLSDDELQIILQKKEQ